MEHYIVHRLNYMVRSSETEYNSTNWELNRCHWTVTGSQFTPTNCHKSVTNDRQKQKWCNMMADIKCDIIIIHYFILESGGTWERSDSLSMIVVRDIHYNYWQYSKCTTQRTAQFEKVLSFFQHYGSAGLWAQEEMDLDNDKMFHLWRQDSGRFHSCRSAWGLNTFR